MVEAGLVFWVQFFEVISECGRRARHWLSTAVGEKQVLPLSLLEWRDAVLHCGVEVGWPTVRAGQTVGMYSLARRQDERMSNLEQSFLMAL